MLYIGLQPHIRIQVGTVVVNLGGRFADGTVNYNIVEGNEGGQFAINPISGLLTTSQPLDREQAGEYRLVIEATPTQGGQVGNFPNF